MFDIVGHEVPQCETVMRSNEVHTGSRTPAAPFIQITGTTQPRCKLRDESPIPFPEMANTIPIFSIPFRPENREVANLIASLCDIPRFRNELHLRQHGILVNNVEEGTQLID